MQTARSWLGAFAAGEASPLDALAECEQAIAQRDGDIGAFAALCLERAHREAAAAETAWRRGAPSGPLCGLPLAVKDLIDTAAVETACGSALLAGRVPERDAEVVRRARAAGAVLIGKTRTHEFAWGYTMAGRDGRPTTRNPRDLDRLTGGSSGGSAAAVAAGMAPLALATDTGGSTRLPAAWCGVTGHKPTQGSLPLEGVWPLAPSLDHVGLMAATAADAALLLHALGGPPPATLDHEPRVAGADALPDPQRLPGAYQPILLSEALAAHRQAGLWPERAGEYAPNVRARLEVAERLAPDEVAAAYRERERLRREMEAVFEEVDLVVSRVAGIGPPRVDEDVDLREHVVPYLVLQDLCGLPACALPDGRQVTGPAGADPLVLAFAAREAAR